MTKPAFTIDLTETLGVPSKNIIKHIMVALGTTVSQGEVIAEKKGLLNTIQIKAPCRAVVESLSEDGLLFLRRDEKGEGQAQSAKPADGREDAKDQGETVSAELKVAKSGSLTDLTSDCQGKILLCGFIPSQAYIFKAEAIGVEGLAVAKEGGDTPDSLVPEGIDFPVIKLDEKMQSLAKAKLLAGKKVSLRKGMISSQKNED